MSLIFNVNNPCAFSFQGENSKLFFLGGGGGAVDATRKVAKKIASTRFNSWFMTVSFPL